MSAKAEDAAEKSGAHHRVHEKGATFIPTATIAKQAAPSIIRFNSSLYHRANPPVQP